MEDFVYRQQIPPCWINGTTLHLPPTSITEAGWNRCEEDESQAEHRSDEITENARRCSSISGSTHSGIFIIGQLQSPLSLLFPHTYKQLGSSTGLCLRADEQILQLQTGESHIYISLLSCSSIKGERRADLQYIYVNGGGGGSIVR